MREAWELAETSITSKRILLVIGTCAIRYLGRASSFLAEGERILIWKPDGTLLIHQDKMRKPVNWNPPGSMVKVKLGDTLDIISWRSRPRERMRVAFNKIDLMVSTHLQDREKIRLLGVEEELVQRIYENPDLLEEGFKVYKMEKPVSSGFIDLYGEDKEGNPVIVEFKGSKADVSAVKQLLRYISEMGERARGILVAPDISRPAYVLLVKNKLRFVKLSPNLNMERDTRGQALLTRYTQRDLG